MRFTIDTTEKTITVSEAINIAELMSTLTEFGVKISEYSIKGKTKQVNYPWVYYPTVSTDVPSSPYYITTK